MTDSTTRDPKLEALLDELREKAVDYGMAYSLSENRTKWDRADKAVDDAEDAIHTYVSSVRVPESASVQEAGPTGREAVSRADMRMNHALSGAMNLDPDDAYSPHDALHAATQRAERAERALAILTMPKPPSLTVEEAAEAAAREYERLKLELVERAIAANSDYADSEDGQLYEAAERDMDAFFARHFTGVLPDAAAETSLPWEYEDTVPLAKDHPDMIAWEAYKATPGYANTLRWATEAQHTEGSLWAAFIAGRESTVPDIREPDGAALIAAERERQRRNGWDLGHDMGHGDGELLDVAQEIVSRAAGVMGDWEDEWGIIAKWTRAHVTDGETKLLVIAGALIAAELDRRANLIGTPLQGEQEKQ